LGRSQFFPRGNRAIPVAGERKRQKTSIQQLARRCSALSSWFTRLVKSATSLFKAIIRPRAMMLSSAAKKDPSPLAIARPLSDKKHQRGKGKQARGQCQGNVARPCRDQDWKNEKGERGNAETLQKLTQVFDILSHHTIPRLDAAGHSFWDGCRAGAAPGER
jgi:hypothetical protein